MNKCRSVMVASLILFFTSATTHAMAQSTYSARTKAALRQKITLTTGPTTLDKVVISLEKQTGLHIEMATYLRGHRLMCNMNNLSARTVLTGLALMIGIQWFESTKAGTLVITAKRTVLPATIEDLPASLRSCLTQDFRDMYNTLPAADMTLYHDLARDIIAARKANDRASVIVYQNARQTSVQRSLDTISLLSNNVISDYAQRKHPLINAQEDGNHIPPGEVRLGILRLMASVFSPGSDGLTVNLVDGLPVQFNWPGKISLQLLNTYPGTSLGYTFRIGVTGGNSLGVSGTVMSLSAPQYPG